MVRGVRLSARCLVWLATVFALAGSVDLHVVADFATAEHGPLGSELSDVALEACDHGDRRHVEAASFEVGESCPLCLRGSSTRWDGSDRVSLPVPVTADAVATATRHLRSMGPAGPPTGRGPPLT